VLDCVLELKKAPTSSDVSASFSVLLLLGSNQRPSD
jgi:hypothetical protein